MKKYFKLLFVLVFALMVFIPSVLADEKPYEYFDFIAKRVDGENIKNTEIKIYASVQGDEKNLTDRTSEFNVVEVMWSECESEDCSLAHEVADDAVFEAGKDYYLMIRINAKNGAEIDVWGTDKAMYNGTPIEELSGEFGNTGNELMIKTKTVEKEVELTDNDIAKEEEDIATPSEVTTIGATDTCQFGLKLCCTTFLGLSLCIWILIIIIIILLIITICIFKNKKEEQETQL